MPSTDPVERLAGYERWLESQPLAPATRRAYHGHARRLPGPGHVLGLSPPGVPALRGVPRELLYDRTKTVVRTHVSLEERRFHPEALASAHHYGFSMRLCKATAPRWTFDDAPLMAVHNARYRAFEPKPRQSADDDASVERRLRGRRSRHPRWSVAIGALGKELDAQRQLRPRRASRIALADSALARVCTVDRIPRIVVKKSRPGRSRRGRPSVQSSHG